ncbi:MAG TPA: thrombospondin type 3 repeat-containing protein [Polyangia bacterium]|nr:thrombospondin type 3 repeat-containing protein [Polyangia bacterium]
MIRKLVLLSGLLAAVAGSPQPARAQGPDGIGVDLFEPALGSQNFLTVHGAEVLPSRQIGIGLYFDYQRDPFTLEQCTASTAQCSGDMLVHKSSLVQNGLQAYLGGAFGIKDIAQIGLGIPIALSLTSTGTELSTSGVTSGGFSTSALGDLYLEGKVRVWRDPRYGLAAAVAPAVTFPTTTDDHHFAGENGVTGRLRAILSLNQGPFAAAANVGVLVRDPVTVAQGNMNSRIEIGQQLLYGASGSYQFPHLARPVRGILELFGRHGFDSYLDSAPMEVDAAVRISLPHAIEASLGGGAGLVRGVGSPLARAFVGLTWAPDYRDRDGDGIPDMDDQCPDQPEDRDGYKDEDGCPDPDNDGDGIPDIKDACPNAPEDHKGRFPNDGCPEDVVDTDGDGIPDVKDKCPNEPEDKDGFQDEDGCPDPDNDGDGIPDAYDECPNEPEDADGFEDDDGCPDPDNDHDGIPDVVDKCPNEPETINGIKDDDGCPDVGPEHVKIAGNEITVDTPITFTRSKLKETAWLLDQMALVLKGHIEIVKLRIESHKQGHESDGDAGKRADAVKDYLVKRGVELGRLHTQVLATPGPTVQFFVEARKEPKPKKGAPPSQAHP